MKSAMNMEHGKVGVMIQTGKSIISLEPGSTQIKALLIGEDHQPIPDVICL